MEKTSAVEALGQGSLLLPALIKAALKANDRLKLYLSLIQDAARRAGDPQSPAMDFQADAGRLGLADAGWIRGFGQGGYLEGDTLILSQFDRWLEAVDLELQIMARPVCDVGPKPHAALAERRDGWHARLEALQEEEGLSAQALDDLTHGDRGRGDSLHLLVMDLHKILNAMAIEAATEDVAGAHAWQISAEDRPWIEAFMRGIHATSALKFGHPGLDTAVTRDGAKLLIQNDIGTNDAHVLVIEKTAHELHLTYSDLHGPRFAFFRRMLEDIGFTWQVMEPQIRAGLNQGKPYWLGHARFSATHPPKLMEALEAAASRIVFVIDWNRARKRLQMLVRKAAAISILETLARENMGHMAWLLAGGEALVFEAMQSVDNEAFRVGDRLDQVLGEAASVAYLTELMRIASVKLREQEPAALIADEARMLLARAMRQKRFEYDSLAEHAAYCHALAQSLADALLLEETGTALEDRLQRAKAWERQADHLLTDARQRAQRQARWRDVVELMDHMDDTADALEEAMFLLGLTANPVLTPLPPDVRRPLTALAEATSAAIQDQIRAIEIARYVDDASGREDGEAFLQALWRILRAERVCDDLLRDARGAIVTALHGDAAAMSLATELATTVEGATDKLLIAAYALRHMVFEKTGGRA